MPMFYLLAILAAFALWLLRSFAYNPLGGFVRQLWRDAEDAMNKDTKDTKEHKNGKVLFNHSDCIRFA